MHNGRVEFRFSAGLFLLCAFVPGVLLAATTPAPAPAPVSYADAYLLERSASALFLAGDRAGALEKYRSAAAVYERLLETAPEANRPGLSARLESCRSRAAEIEKARSEEEAARTPLCVHFIDVGQGDSVLIRCPDGSTVLIDGGPISCYPFLIPYLRKAGVERINLLIATHPDGDHIGGLIKVLKEFPVDTVVDPGKPHTTVTYQRFLEAVRASPKTAYRMGKAGDRYAFGEAEIRLFHPGASLPANNNNASVVARLSCRGVAMLFTGDAETPAEQEMLKRGGLGRVAVLKVAHHGSASSSSARFLSALSPRLAVISVGAGNSYGHPRPDTLKRLKAAGAEILRTDELGTIVLVCDAKGMRREFPGKAVYPEYDTPAEQAGKIVGDRVTLIYYQPGARAIRRIPPEEREYFPTSAAAEAAGFFKSWR